MSNDKLGMTGQPLYINLPDNSPIRISRALGRVANLMEHLEQNGPRLSQTQREAAQTEIMQQTKLLDAYGYKVPETTFKIRRLVEEIQQNG